MKINIFFLESDKKFTKKYKLKLERVIRNTAENNIKLLDLSGKFINFTIYPCKNFSDGWTMTKDWIRICIPRKVSEKYLIGLVSHEMHHLKTGHYFYSKKKIFLDTLFSEGLAVVFQVEQSKEVLRYYKYDKNLLKKWLPVLKKQNLLSKDYDYYEWFWGQGKKPRFLGYKLSKYLIDQIRKNYPNLTILNLTKKKPMELLRLSKIKI